MAYKSNDTSNVDPEKKFDPKNPRGLGDPDDTRLRKVEKEILIPKKVREVTKVEKCAEEVKMFTKCCSDNNFSMVYKCREENTTMKSCLEKWYKDPDLIKRCQKEYLEERTEYRRTGVKHKASRYQPP